jgi:hypothetical protein
MVVLGGVALSYVRCTHVWGRFGGGHALFGARVGVVDNFYLFAAMRAEARFPRVCVCVHQVSYTRGQLVLQTAQT